MALGCSTKASFLHPPGPPRALRERCHHPSGTCETAGGQGWGLERSKRRGSQGCHGPYSPCPGRRQLCSCDKSAWGLQGSRSSPWRLGSRQSQRRGNPSPVCPRKWLCTLCRGNGEQSCLLTTVGGDPEAMIPLRLAGVFRALWAPYGSHLWDHSPGFTLTWQLLWPLHCGTSVAQAGPGGKSSWETPV